MAGTVRVRAAFTERSNGQMILGAPKSRAGLRTVSIPAAILPDLAVHLTEHTRPGSDALVFTGVKGGPLRRSDFNKISGWPHVVTGMDWLACTPMTCDIRETRLLLTWASRCAT
jgi:hypothetical protein